MRERLFLCLEVGMIVTERSRDYYNLFQEAFDDRLATADLESRGIDYRIHCRGNINQTMLLTTINLTFRIRQSPMFNGRVED